MISNTSAAAETDRPCVAPASVRLIEWIILAAGSAVLMVGLLKADPLQSANDRSRWCTVWSLVERGTFAIDEIDRDPRWSTIDKVRHRRSESEDWHLYSSKPPLLSVIVAGLYFAERRTLGWGLYSETTAVTHLLLFFVNILPAIAAWLALRQILLRARVRDGIRLSVLAAACLATMLNPYQATLNNHTPAVVCLIFALLARMSAETEIRSRGPQMAAVGFFAALTSCFELPAALFGVWMFLSMCRLSVYQTAKWFVPAALVPLAAFFLTNYLLTGGIRPFYTYYGTETYLYVHEGIPSYWNSPRGLDANAESTAVYLFHCVLGHHGLFSLTPFLLLAVPGWFLAAFGRGRADAALPVSSEIVRHSADVFRRIVVGGGVLTVAVLCFYLTRTQNYNYGGNSSALRWMLWLTPFLLAGTVPALELFVQQRGWFRQFLLLIAGGLFAVSAASSLNSLSRPWKPNWIYNWMEAKGVVDYSTPYPAFSPGRTAVLRFSDASTPAAEFYCTDGRRLRIEPAGNVDALIPEQSLSKGDGDWSAWRVHMDHAMDAIEEADDGEKLPGRSESVVLLIDAKSEAAGNDPGEWLSVFIETKTGGLAPAEPIVLDRWVKLVRGLPSVREYNNGGSMWLRPPGQGDAVACRKAASRVPVTASDGRRIWVRCDVVYCSALPLGVRQWTISHTDETDGALVHRVTWRSTADPFAAQEN